MFKKISTRKYVNLFLLVFLCSLLTSINNFGATWTKVEGTNDYINTIFVTPDNPEILAVGSNNENIDVSREKLTFNNFGNGLKLSLDSGKTFGETKLDGFTVLDLIQSTDNKNWYASITQLKRGGLIISTDAGNSWDTMNIHCDAPYQIMKMQRDMLNNRILGSAINTNRGLINISETEQTCSQEENVVVQSKDLRISKVNPEFMFMAGDGLLEGRVMRSLDSGKTWQKEESGLNGLRVHCVLPSSNIYNPGLLYCGADSIDQNKVLHGKGIYRSIDTGKTWNLVAAFGESIYDLKEHPGFPNFIIAAGGSSGVWVSANWGAYWEAFNSGLPDGSFARCIAIPNWEPNEEGIIAFVGTSGNGLYKSGRLITGISETKAAGNFEFQLAPQPFTSELNINCSGSETEQISIEILDLLGQSVFLMQGSAGSDGFASYRWIPDNSIMPGVYFVNVKKGNYIRTEKVLFTR